MSVDNLLIVREMVSELNGIIISAEEALWELQLP